MTKLFLDLDGTLARFNVPNAIERFKEEKDFFFNLKPYKGIECIDKIAKNNNNKTIEVYVISASYNEKTDNDKMKWIKKFLPNIKENNITFSRLGDDKAKIIEEKYNFKIDKSCFLLDDYTKNLNEWEEKGGIGIKRLTYCSDNSRGLWKGLTCKDLTRLIKIFN